MWALFLSSVSTSLAVGFFTTPYFAAATFSYSLMIMGLVQRKVNFRFHIVLMCLAMGIDLSLVLLLEWQRGATETAMSFELSVLQQAHIGFSTLAVLLYLPQMYLGLRKKPSPWHKRLGWTVFALRTLGFIFMFSLLEKP